MNSHAPKVLQLRPAKQKAVVAPAVYRPQPTPKVLQTKSTVSQNPQAVQTRKAVTPPLERTVQLSRNRRCNCRQSGNSHSSSCPANKNFNRNKKVEVKKEERKLSTFENLKCYRAGWVSRNQITEHDVQRWGGTIHGHCSSKPGKNKKEHPRTTSDLNAFKEWFTDTYRRWE